MVANYDYVVVRYGEMILKGRNKKDFIKRLANNLRQAFKGYPALIYHIEHDRIYIELNDVAPTKLITILKTVFGISSFSFAVKVQNDLTLMIEQAANLAKANVWQTFKIKAHRSYKNFAYNSDQINRAIASEILKTTDLKVDVHRPDLLLLVEVREHYTYLMDNKIIGAQGFPVGSSNKVLLLLSGGIDSVVAGYLAMKRGLRIECIHFESAPYTSYQAFMKVKELTKCLSLYQGKVKLHTIPFTKLQLAVNDAVPENYSITIVRRMMMRIAQKVANDNRCLALVNGESIGQVASQTIESMQVIGEVVTLPIIRPLATYDKSEIIQIAKLIGSYETSILPYSDCCTIFTPQNPTTRPKGDKAERYEKKIAYNDLIEEAVIAKNSLFYDYDDVEEINN